MPHGKYIEIFFNTIDESSNLSELVRKDILKFLKFMPVKKGKIILMEGSPCNQLYFLCKGLFRSFYHGNEGEDITSAFSFENEFFTNVKGFVNQINSNETIQAIEPSYICAIDRNDYFNIIYKYPYLMGISHHTINKHRVELEDRIRVLQHGNASDKLAFFNQYYPGLQNRVPKKFIATFLGMRYETMHRNSKKIAL